MTRRLTGLAALVLAAALLLGACGTSGGGLIALGKQSGAGHGGPELRKLNWKEPLGNGLDAGPATARSAGQLPFSPVFPRFAVAPMRVQVTDPTDYPDARDRGMAAVYVFPKGRGLPATGPVVLNEQGTSMATEQLRYQAQSNASVAGVGPSPTSFRMVDVGGQEAELISAGGVARIRFVRAGLLFDITGPGLTPQAAQRLAAEVVAAVPLPS